MEKVKYADILAGVDESWSIKEKAKYIYNEICKKSSYDERFIYSKNPELLKQIYNMDVNVDEYVNPKLICKTLNGVYSELLNRVGIRNKIIKKPSSINQYFEAEDIALIFFDEDSMPYFTAIAADIQRCKYGMKTQFFGGCDNNYPEGKRDSVCIIKTDELEEVKEKIFPDSPQMQEELTEKLEKYHLEKEVIRPKRENTIKKFQKQHLTTDTGIEITIPMEEYKNPDRVEFLTNPDGTVSVLIKNIGRLRTK